MSECEKCQEREEAYLRTLIGITTAVKKVTKGNAQMMHHFPDDYQVLRSIDDHILSKYLAGRGQGAVEAYKAMRAQIAEEKQG